MPDNAPGFHQLVQHLGLAAEDLISEERILEAIARLVEDLIHHAPDQLFSMLYRLDISEKKIRQAMTEADDIPKKIAFLIYERQLEKIISRRENKSGEPDADLAW